MTIQLRDYQRAAIDAIYTYFEHHRGNCLIVVPTAGGKSLIMASFIKEAIEFFPDTRILVVTHVRELISQNHAELLNLWPDAPAGIYSAGLNQRDTESQVLFCGIQSVADKAYDIQKADLVLVDECHLIPRNSDTRYQKFLGDLKKINPQVKVVGLTATPYRLDSGMLHRGSDALFSDIAFNVPVLDLVKDGYLAPLVSKNPLTKLDVSGVGTKGGEFIASQLEAAVDIDCITQAAVNEIIAYGLDRRSWLLFCSGVNHAKHVSEAVRAKGFSCETIFGDTPKMERDRIIDQFKQGHIRALASMGVLTTGFNAPAVDLIAMLRPTKSTGLYVQIAGRGMRNALGKSNCLVLDFAGNVSRHGPIDQITAVDRNKEDEEKGVPPTKECPVCHNILHAAVKYCTCGHEFPATEAENKLELTATTQKILTDGKPEYVPVEFVTYFYHYKPDKPTSMRAEYLSGLNVYNEWICLEHEGRARMKAQFWWRQRTDIKIPSSIDEAMENVSQLAVPKFIAIKREGRFISVTGYLFEEDLIHAQ